MNHVSVSPTYGNEPTQEERRILTRVGIEPKVVGSIPTLVRVFLCPCVGPFPLVGLTLTWFIYESSLLNGTRGKLMSGEAAWRMGKSASPLVNLPLAPHSNAQTKRHPS